MADMGHGAMSPKGGKRENAGRPKLPVPGEVHSVHITAEQVAYAKRLGDGELSAGIRRIIDEHMTVMPRPAGAGHVCERCEVNRAPMKIEGAWVCFSCLWESVPTQPSE